MRSAIRDHWHGVIDDTLPPVTEDSMPGELANIVSGRVANVLDLRGPNFITDAACASSFAAVNAAVELLIEHQCRCRDHRRRGSQHGRFDASSSSARSAR